MRTRPKMQAFVAIYRTRRIHGVVYIMLRGWKTDKVCGHKYAVLLS